MQSFRVSYSKIIHIIRLFCCVVLLFRLLLLRVHSFCGYADLMWKQKALLGYQVFKDAMNFLALLAYYLLN